MVSWCIPVPPPPQPRCSCGRRVAAEGLTCRDLSCQAFIKTETEMRARRLAAIRHEELEDQACAARRAARERARMPKRPAVYPGPRITRGMTRRVKV